MHYILIIFTILLQYNFASLFFEVKSNLYLHFMSTYFEIILCVTSWLVPFLQRVSIGTKCNVAKMERQQPILQNLYDVEDWFESLITLAKLETFKIFQLRSCSSMQMQ